MSSENKKPDNKNARKKDKKNRYEKAPKRDIIEDAFRPGLSSLFK